MKLNDSRAVEPLIEALQDEVSSVRRNANLALEKITKEYFGKDPVKWQQWWERKKSKKWWEFWK